MRYLNNIALIRPKRMLLIFRNNGSSEAVQTHHSHGFRHGTKEAYPAWYQPRRSSSRRLAMGLYSTCHAKQARNDNISVDSVDNHRNVDQRPQRNRSPEPTDSGKSLHHLRAHPDRLEGAFPVALDDVHVGHRAAPYGRGESDDV